MIYKEDKCNNYYTSNSPIRVEISGEYGTALLAQNEGMIQLNGQVPRTVSPPARLEVNGETYWGSYDETQIRDIYRSSKDDREILCRKVNNKLYT